MIDYKSLRKINPEAARLAVVEYLDSNNGNISGAAKAFNIQRCVIYDILRKQKEGNLRDGSRMPIHSPNKTASGIEDKVIEIKNKTHLGPKRLSKHLKKYCGLEKT